MVPHTTQSACNAFDKPSAVYTHKSELDPGILNFMCDFIVVSLLVFKPPLSFDAGFEV